MLNIHNHHKSPKSIFNHYPGDEIQDEYFSIGIHPWYLDNPEEQFQQLKEKSKSVKCLAIGECGLDKLTKAPLPLQTEFFIKQIHLAEELQKPVIIHCVKAHNEMLKIVKELKPKIPLIFHGFNQKQTILDSLKEYPFYFSFGKDLLTENSNAQKVLLNINLNQVFFETDDNENISIAEIYHKASKLLNLSLQELETRIEENFKKVFNARL